MSLNMCRQRLLDSGTASAFGRKAETLHRESEKICQCRYVSLSSADKVHLIKHGVPQQYLYYCAMQIKMWGRNGYWVRMAQGLCLVDGS